MLNKNCAQALLEVISLRPGDIHSASQSQCARLGLYFLCEGPGLKCDNLHLKVEVEPQVPTERNIRSLSLHISEIVGISQTEFH